MKNKPMSKPLQACIVTAFLFLSSLICQAQMIIHPVRVISPEYTMFWNTKSLFNPAATATESIYEASITGRGQWVGHKDAPLNLGLMLGMKSDILHGGAGFDYSFARYGQTLINHDFKLNYSYHMKLGEDRLLSAGISAGMTLMKYDFPFDEPLIDDNGHDTFYDFQFGLFYRSTHLRLGLSSTHFQYFDPYSEKNTLTLIHWYSSYGFDITDKIEFRPELLILFPELKTDDLALSTGFIATLNKIFQAGFTYRTNNSYGFTSGVNIAGKLQLGYLFEYTINKPGQALGNHEFMMSFSM